MLFADTYFYNARGTHMYNLQRTAAFRTAFLIRTLFYWLCLYYFELLLRISSMDTPFTLSLFRVLLTTLPLAITLAAVITLIPARVRRKWAIAIMGVLAFIVSSQVVYKHIFPVFWVIGSVENGAQAMTSFFGKMISAIVESTLWIELAALSLWATHKFEKKLRTPVAKRNHVLFVVAIATIANLFIWLTYIPAARDKNSALGDFYGRNSSINTLYERSGLFGALGIQAMGTLVEPAPDSSLDDIGNLPIESGNPSPTVAPTSTGTGGGTTPTVAPSPGKTEYNALDIDFQKLADESEDERLKQLNEYFAKCAPSEKNEYTGKFEGYNLIMLTAESFAPYAVSKELTPTLYKMIHEGFNFTNFYNPPWAVSTSDGEYVSCVGLLPKPDVWSFYRTGRDKMWLPYTMGRQFESLGIHPFAYHNNTYNYYHRDLSHPNMGYEYKGPGHGLDINDNIWPESDNEMIEKSIDDYIDMPRFHAYYMTVSGHMEYDWSANIMAQWHKDAVKDLPYSERCKAFVACNLELEKALTTLLAKLREKGIADKTLIVLSPDHYPYGLTNDEIAEFGQDVSNEIDLSRSSLIMYVDGMEPVQIDKPCTDLDIIPTISNLLGLKFDSRLLMGTDILSNSPALVCFDSRSFVTDKGRYLHSTEEFTPNEGETVDDSYVETVSKIVNAKFAASEAMLDLDYYRWLEPLLTGSEHPKEQ